MINKNAQTSQIRPPCRTALAVDIENALKSSSPSEAEASHLAFELQRLFDFSPDLTIVAANPRNAFVAQQIIDLFHGSTRCRSGKNGADFAIIDWLEEIPSQNLRNPQRPVTHVYLVSGDGIFVTVVNRLRNAGVFVTVVAHRECLHRDLLRVANCTLFLGDSNAFEIAA